MEAADVLNVLGIQGPEGEGGAGGTARSRERPADVLLCKVQDVRVGAAGGAAAGRVALDVGVVRRRLYIWPVHRRAWARRRLTPVLSVIGRRWRRGVESQGWFFSQ